MGLDYRKTFEIEIINEFQSAIHSKMLNFVLNNEFDKSDSTLGASGTGIASLIGALSMPVLNWGSLAAQEDMSMNAAPEIAFSSEQGKANYAAARRQYPAQAIPINFSCFTRLSLLPYVALFSRSTAFILFSNS